MITEKELNLKSVDGVPVPPTMRESRVRALALSDLIYLNKNDFFQCKNADPEFNECDIVFNDQDLA